VCEEEGRRRSGAMIPFVRNYCQECGCWSLGFVVTGAKSIECLFIICETGGREQVLCCYHK